MNMDDPDAIPVKDSAEYMDGKSQFKQRALQQKGLITKWSRSDLEDKYLRLYEDNLVLKKHTRKQDEKIKKMATKLLRLVGDKKKIEQTEGVRKVRDVETEEMLEELHGKIRELEKQNQHLKEKLLVAKQQVMTQSKRTTPYSHVPARINTGMGVRTTTDPRLTKNMRVSGPVPHHTKQRPQSPTMPRYGHSLLEEARAEIQQLEVELEKQAMQVTMANHTIDELREQMHIREEEFEDDLLKLKQQMNLGQRATVQENIDTIRLQREVKEKATKLTALQTQYQSLEQKLHEVKASHNNLLQELETSNHQLKQEQSKNLTLNNELKQGSSAQRRVIELQERTTDLERECDILKEANEKLVNSAFDLEREREWRKRENALKVQIAQLEATLKADVGEKGTILDKLTDEKEHHEKLHDEHKEIKIKYYQMKQECDDLKEKMSFFTQESAIDLQEIEEALVLVKQKKQHSADTLDFLESVEQEEEKDKSKVIRDLQAEHAETINELEKTRNMLLVQHKINNNYHMEVEAVTSKMEENRLEYESRLEEYAQLLDIRAARIRKLEAQLRDVAYGTRQHRIRTDGGEDTDEEPDHLADTIQLEKDQNLFEIHVKTVLLSQEALRRLGDQEPALFATWEFYEFETQATPVMKGPRLEYQFTSQYLVKVDDFFLHYLQKDSTTLELHQSFGTDYRTVAACQLSMKKILEQSHGRIHGSVQLTGLDPEGEGQGMNFGTVEFWVRLRVPIEQAMRCYRERSKALGYITTNQRMDQQALEVMDENVAKRPPDNINELDIKITACAKVKARREGIQPSPYVMYKFFDYDDHDTPIVTSSNSPQYNDHKTYPVPMTADLDKYLKTYPLQVYVFDDTDPDDSAYLGVASVPLISLAHDKPLKGTFELYDMSGNLNGTIDISLKWKYMYIPPKISAKTKEQLAVLTGAEMEPLAGPHLLPGEETEMYEGMATTTSTENQSLPHGGGGGAAPGGFHSTAPMKQPRRPRRPADGQPMSHTSPNYMAAEKDMSMRMVTPQQSRLEPSRSSVGSTPAASASYDQQQQVMMSRSVISDTIKEESEPEGSIYTEGSHVDGESDVMSSSDADDITPRPAKPTSRHAKPDREPTVDEMISEELGESVPKSEYDESTLHDQDTMFGDEAEQDEGEDEDMGEAYDDDDDYEEEAAAEAAAAAAAAAAAGDDQPTDGGETTDSEGVVMPSPHATPTSAVTNPDVVRVVVSSLSFNENSGYIMEDPSISLLFVEYGWPGVPREETETVSLPKPNIHGTVSYNFQKVIHVDFDENLEKRQWLANMLVTNEEEEAVVRFTVVTEPDSSSVDENNGTCDDIGVATVRIADILDNQADIIDQDIPVISTQEEGLEIGTIKLTVECLAALQAIQLEM